MYPIDVCVSFVFSPAKVNKKKQITYILCLNIEKYNKKTTTIRMNDGRYVYICYYIHAPTQLVAPRAVTMAVAIDAMI